ncbi:serine/threonine protein kinase [Paenibacillus sp.]|uniref:serine/threonine protein kinase n=1 Tax=Paenibacillus sp. TaxID=58172 RepID=UPI002D6D9CE9|nr:protein kinase [Paenibacillus sp.]HZG57845.1 protein kinase [Paenibacillus sp.]
MPKWWIAATKAWNGWKRRRALGWFRPGATVRGRYKIVKPIGEGSYGLAYLCRDKLADGGPCVLKHVQPLRGGKQRTEAAFALETDMLDRLRHPAVPRLLEKFVYRGAMCFTMEYAPGVSLEKLLFDEDRTFSEREALLLLRRLTDVVADVHRRGIVHRDIRIANVILDGDCVRLIDFGLARDLDPNAPDPVPDDVLDDDPMEKKLRRRIDRTSDFYAMGHLLLFLLYSTYPDVREERSWEEELHRLSPATKRLLRRMLMTEQPYASAEALAEELDAAIAATAEAS